MNFVNIEAKHYHQIESIYLQGIASGIATFQTSAPTWEEWDKNHLKICRIALLMENEIVGWTALSPISNRFVYAGVGEVSIYMSKIFRSQGLGKILLNQLIVESENNGIWTLQSGIFPQNTGSIKLHESSGFRMIGFRERIGSLNGIWYDNVLMERRSEKVGL